MTRSIILTLIALNLISNLKCNAAEADSTNYTKDLKFRYSALIVPTILIGYGALGIRSDKMENFNAEIKEDLTENIDQKITIDDIMQYMPFATVYALNGFGISGENNFKDRTIILASAYMLMSSTVIILKNTTHVMRPDGSSENSFPSGHTATAFVGAEFLYQEYKDVSIWYGVAGYSVAAATGFFRMYNDRHWLTDVAAGAGIGMLSTKVAYWTYPYYRHLFYSHSKKSSTNAMILPFYNGRLSGVNLTMHF